tara:strand:- start:1104 stop:1250 length:147 start_codon:yes stop_codon:yes gene_type:complete
MIKARTSGRKTLMIIENLIEHYHPKNKPASESKKADTGTTYFVFFTSK